MVVGGSEGELLKSKTDSCAVCGRRVMANSVLHTKCGGWVYGRCVGMRRVAAGLAMRFVCLGCVGVMERAVDSIEKLCDEVDAMNGFCYLGDRLG